MPKELIEISDTVAKLKSKHAYQRSKDQKV